MLTKFEDVPRVSQNSASLTPQNKIFERFNVQD